jgi:hypothetical protein
MLVYCVLGNGFRQSAVGCAAPSSGWWEDLSLARCARAATLPTDLPADRAYVYIRVNLVSPPAHHVLGALLLLQCVQSLLREFVIVPYMTNDREQ